LVARRRVHEQVHEARAFEHGNQLRARKQDHLVGLRALERVTDEALPEALYGPFPIGPVYEGAAELEDHRAHHAGSLAWTRTSEKPLKAKFAELLTHELRRTPSRRNYFYHLEDGKISEFWVLADIDFDYKA
jgi:hypothetical protein